MRGVEGGGRGNQDGPPATGYRVMYLQHNVFLAAPSTALIIVNSMAVSQHLCRLFCETVFQLEDLLCS